MNRDNTAFRPGGLFHTKVTIQRWEPCAERHGNQIRKSPAGTFEVVGLLNGPFFFILLEEIEQKTDDDYINVLTPWGRCAFDYYDFRDHCAAVLNPDGSKPKWSQLRSLLK